jgi:hypothetical protein
MLWRSWSCILVQVGIAVGFATASRAAGPHAPPSAVQSAMPAAAPSQPESAADLGLPRFLPGNWQYQRAVISATGGTPQQATISKCADPSQEMHDKLVELTHKGCRFSPTTHAGNAYSTTWTCPAHGGLLAMSQVITVTGDSSYEDSSEARFQDQVTRTKIVATRIGECPLLPAAPTHRHRPSPLTPPSGG